MKDWRNTSSEDVSSTSRTSQSLTNSSQALRTTSSSSFVLCRSLHNKISQNSLDSDHSLSRISHMQKLFEKMAKIPGTWTFLSLEISKHAKASRISETLSPLLFPQIVGKKNYTLKLQAVYANIPIISIYSLVQKYKSF